MRIINAVRMPMTTATDSLFMLLIAVVTLCASPASVIVVIGDEVVLDVELRMIRDQKMRLTRRRERRRN